MESTDVVGVMCMRGHDETFYLNEKDRAKFWKAYMSKIKYEWDQIADADSVE